MFESYVHKFIITVMVIIPHHWISLSTIDVINGIIVILYTTVDCCGVFKDVLVVIIKVDLHNDSQCQR